MSQLWQEPTQITQGDTLCFRRHLSRYPAGQGWSLIYALRGNGQDIEFVSAAQGDNHLVDVLAATTEGWLPATYEMEGFAINGLDRKQIYLGTLVITPDLITAAPDVDVRTHAQKMVESIQGQLEKNAKNMLQSTTVEGTVILRQNRKELLQMRQAYVQERRGEIAKERAKNGQPSQRKIKTVFYITAPASCAMKQFGAGNSVYNTDWQ